MGGEGRRHRSDPIDPMPLVPAGEPDRDLDRLRAAMDMRPGQPMSREVGIQPAPILQAKAFGESGALRRHGEEKGDPPQRPGPGG